MADDLETALDALRAAADASATTRPEIREKYLAFIRVVEALPQNAPGADKTAQLDRMFATWAHDILGPLPRRA